MLKKFLHVFLTSVIIINALCFGNVFARSSKIIEMSYGKEFSASGSGTGEITELSDGITDGGGYFVTADAVNTPVWISVDLENAYDITGITLYPQSGEYSGGFPQSVDVIVSENADFSQPATVYSGSVSPETMLNLENANGRYVKIQSAENGGVNGQYGMGFAEVTVNADTYSKKSLLSYQKSVTVAQSIGGTYAVCGSTSAPNPGNLTDGTSAVGGYSNANTRVDNYKIEYAPNVRVYFIIDLGAECEISNVALTPRAVESARYGSYYPIQFEIHASDTEDFASYTTLYKSEGDEYDFEIDKNIWGDQTAFGKAVGPTSKQTYKAAGSGRYVRIVTTKNSFIANGGHTAGKKYIWPHFAEIEVNGQPAATELSNVSSGRPFKSYALNGWDGKLVSGSTTENITLLSDGAISKDSRAVFTAGNPSTASDSPGTRQICFETDFGASAYIKQVKLSPDIYMKYGSRFPVGFVLEASENADFSKAVTLYSTDSYWDDPNPWYEAGAKVKAGPMETQVFDVSGKGRYFRIRTTKNSASYNGANDAQGYIQIGFTEIEVLAGSEDFAMTNTYYSNGSEITTLDGADSVTVSTQITNNTGYVQDAFVIRVLYNGNKMTDVKVNRLLFDGTVSLDNAEFALSETDKENYTVKTMLWDGSEFLKPYIKNLTFPVE